MSDSTDDSVPEWALRIFVLGFAAFFGFAIAYWVWPWLGPQMFDPCPRFTSLGIGLYAAHSAVKGLGNRLRTERDADIKRRLARLEGRR